MPDKQVAVMWFDDKAQADSQKTHNIRSSGCTKTLAITRGRFHVGEVMKLGADSVNVQ
jgi:hypothetical protein